MKSIASATLLSLALIGAGSTFAQTATTDPVGFVTVTVPAVSDAMVAVPLNRTPEFKGMIQTIAGNTITVAGTSPAWATAPQKWVFASPTQNSTYAVQFASGVKEGMTAKIISNTANSVTIQLNAGENLTGVVPEDADGVANNGDQIDIMPYWTPSTLVPSTAAVGTSILGFVGVGAGVNLSSTQIFAYGGGGVWEDGFTSEDATHTPIRFGTGFILRNPGASSLPVSFVGSVPMTKYWQQLATLAANTDQDIAFGYSSPIPETLNNLGLVGLASDGDTILGFNNNATGYNKSATQLYVMDGGAWVDGFTSDPIGATVQLQPGFGYVFRKFRTGSPSTTVWADLPSYLTP